MTSPDEHATPDSADAAADGDAVELADGELDSPDEGLLSRLAVIEDQPLDARAAAFGQLYDGLRQQLEA